MQQLIRTPEQIFREEGKDIYFIRFQYENAEGYFASPDQVELPVRKAMLAWLREHVPNSRVEYLAPSEYSGRLIGYFGDVRVDFSEIDLAAYCARWENMDGTSIDPRFQCSRLPYDCWVEKRVGRDSCKKQQNFA